MSSHLAQGPFSFPPINTAGTSSSASGSSINNTLTGTSGNFGSYSSNNPPPMLRTLLPFQVGYSRNIVSSNSSSNTTASSSSTRQIMSQLSVSSPPVSSSSSSTTTDAANGSSARIGRDYVISTRNESNPSSSRESIARQNLSMQRTSGYLYSSSGQNLSYRRRYRYRRPLTTLRENPNNSENVGFPPQMSDEDLDSNSNPISRDS